MGSALSFGKYVLERRLAVGGTSEVFLAHPRVGHHPSAHLVVKRLLPMLLEDPTALGMFAQEAQLHRLVKHPNVVEVFEAGVVNGEPFLALEYIDGVDASLLMRRSVTEARTIPVPLAVHIVRSVCAALDSVHNATSPEGEKLGIVHRDVSPSNIYLSVKGEIKLGDFGIARPNARAARSTKSNMLKGKYNYLSPEQVSGEPFDYRADIFSLGVVLAEMLIGAPLFTGSGELAVLLAIRDCRLDPLRAFEPKLPAGLVAVVERALQKSPEHRYASASEFSSALAPFEVWSGSTRELLSSWVDWTRETSILRGSQDRFRAVGLAPVDDAPGSLDAPFVSGATPKPSVATQAGPQVRRPTPAPDSNDDLGVNERRTINYEDSPSYLRDTKGVVSGPVTFARLIELIVTGQLGADDEVNLMGQGFKRIGAIDLLERHLPTSRTTRTIEGPAPPDMIHDLSRTRLLEVLALLHVRRETGLLLLENPTSNAPNAGRKEVYLQRATVFHVASAEAGELLGQRLVRRGTLASEELDMALAVMPRFDGRLGDTLIALGLIDPVMLFQAIEEQGRERLLSAFSWTTGTASFFRGVSASRVEFPLDLDLGLLMIAGLELSESEEAVKDRYRDSRQ
ncbi:MAG: protein kinase, partial [Polyangiaceae bacterium]